MNAMYTFSDNTLATLKKLVDANGLPLWSPSLILAEPDRIMGYQYQVNQDMADVGTGNAAVAFGDFSKHMVRLVNGIRLKRLDEIAALNDQVVFVGFSRLDSKSLTAGFGADAAIKTLTIA